jgi:two-component system sensor histidine kinase and response regulator WspE
MGLAGEFRVSAGWIRTHTASMLTLKKRQSELMVLLDHLQTVTEEHELGDRARTLLRDAQQKADDCRQALAARLAELDDFDRRTGNLSGRLSHEVISSRMRPFGDGVHGFQRMVRDVARSLGKQVDLRIVGTDTQVDRDILDKIEAPLNHILRNAVDHGLETPEERMAAGKPAEGTIVLEAMHNAGMLSIIIKDDGRGVDLDALRRKIVAKGMVSEGMARDLSESELLDFLFLPSFSTRDQVTEISGRGVGLDVVHNAVQEMRGQIRASTKPGKGLRLNLQLPLTLSVVRSLMVEIGNELYAFPLARVESILKVERSAIATVEDRQFITHEGQHIGLVDATQVLGCDTGDRADDLLSVVIIGDRSQSYGLVVGRFAGERELAVRALDPRLAKVKDISAAAVTETGEPLLILDVDDMLRSIENLVSGRRLSKVRESEKGTEATGKRVLIVDDSLTVREVERKLLESRGYDVDVAVDGMDGWNTVRLGSYDLVISDVDMPRMNGIEFVGLIKTDPKLKALPVMIVSYKDRPEDRDRGLQAGADYYLAKGSFHDETLLDAVVDLIGEARA